MGGRVIDANAYDLLKNARPAPRELVPVHKVEHGIKPEDLEGKLNAGFKGGYSVNTLRFNDKDEAMIIWYKLVDRFELEGQAIECDTSS